MLAHPWLLIDVATDGRLLVDGGTLERAEGSPPGHAQPRSVLAGCAPSRCRASPGPRSGEHVDIEMQNARQPTQPERALYYWAKMYLSGLQRGQGYEDLRPCIGIWLLGYRQLPGERSHTILKLRDIDGHADFSEHLELHTVELPKLPKCEGQWPRGSLEAWGRFLGARSREELREAAMNQDPELQKAWEEVERLNRDPATKRLAQKRETDLHMYQLALGGAHREGRTERGVEAVLEVLEARGLSVTEEQKARIVACKDLDLLRRWLRRAATAASTDEVFAE